MLIFINIIIAVLGFGMGFVAGSLWMIEDLHKHPEGDDEE